jgi:hypothetical protein
MATPAGTPSSPLRIDLARHVGVEIGRSATTQVSLGETATRNLAGKPSGTIKLSDLWSKSSEILVTISADIVNHTINISSIPGYVAGKTNIRIKVNPGVYVYSTSTSIPALTITGATTGDNIILENNGYIMGKGGGGGDARGGRPLGYTVPGTPGGPAISLTYPAATMSIATTNGYIAGGGGGGGCGVGEYAYGGGGAGGGEGGGRRALASTATYPPYTGGDVAGGLPGRVGSNGPVFYVSWDASWAASGGGGGRILPGNRTPGNPITWLGRTPGDPDWTPTYTGLGGTGGQAGGSGGTQAWVGSPTTGGYGGASGEVGQSGLPGGVGGAGGGGGGWGASGGAGAGQIGFYLATPGGSGGQAITLNGKAVTFIGPTTGRIFGAIS